MNETSPILATWRRLSGTAPGRWLFSRLVCWKAPYFSTIRPRISVLEPGRCEVRIRKRRAVLNHIGTVHAIAMCNMAELAAGTATEVTVPRTHRWIPKRMSVEYQNKATTNLRATALIELPQQLGNAQEIAVRVQVTDEAGSSVLLATIQMWITIKKP